MKKTKLIPRIVSALLLAVLFITGCTVTNKGDDVTSSEDTTAAADITPEEYTEMNNKIKEWFLSELSSDKAPFSFKIDGKSSDDFISGWKKEITEGKGEDGTETVTVVYSDTETGLTFTVDGKFYNNYPAVEYVVYIENTGSENSPVICNLNSLDLDFKLKDDDGSYCFKTSNGCSNTTNGDHLDFGLVTKTAESGHSEQFSCSGGRSSSCGWPYFDIYGDKCGLMLAIGWTGQWVCHLTNNGDGTVGMDAGLQYFEAYIKPGEKIRTPSYTFLYYEAEPDDAHNIFRSFILNDIMYDGGDEKITYLPSSVCWYGHGETNSISDFKRISWNEYAIDNYWVDAGWYGNSTVSGGDSTCDSWSKDVGDWDYNTEVFPNGLKKVTDAAHKYGLTYTLWFELERASKSSKTATEHRDYYYTAEDGDNLLLNLGNEDAYNWMYNFLDYYIGEQGVDIYRQDFNIEPLKIWRRSDEKNRVGINETYHITNLYKMYDELHEKYPNLIIDDCASGGRRLDIEMMKRCVVLLRSDYITGEYSETDYVYPACSMEAVQYQVQSVNYWLPVTGTGGTSYVYDTYRMRSMMSSGVVFKLPSSDTDKTAKKLISEASDARKYYSGLFYQLLTPTFDKTSLQAYEAYREDLESGIIMIYCRPQCEETSVTLNIKGLEADAEYIITDADDSDYSFTATGKELLDGYKVESLTKSEARLLYIAKK